MAFAFQKKENFEQAKTFYQKSLTEHRTPETLTRLSEVEKILKEREKEAYLNPEVALEEKNKGNSFFQKGRFLC